MKKGAQTMNYNLIFPNRTGRDHSFIS